MMKQEALFKKLGNILAELNDQYQFLSQNPEQLSELELELFLANANFLADHIHIIKKLNLPAQAPAVTKPNFVKETKASQEEVDDEPEDVQQVEEALTFSANEQEEPAGATAEEESEPLAPPVVEEHEREIFKFEEDPAQTFEFILNTDQYSENDKFDFEEKTTEQLFDRPLSSEEERILEQKKKVKENLIRNPEDLEEDEIGPEPFLVQKEALVAATPKVEPTTFEPPKVEQPKVELPEARPQETVPVAPIAEVSKVVVETTKIEVESEYKPTINDILAGKNVGSRINESSGGSTITDLKSAISLNDKLLYIKDLFNGYNLAYAEAIDIANRLPNFDAADNFFQKNYAVKNNWADKQATVDKFYVLLNRRFKD
jgi:hypothetical protein